jgi:hypothetical protein
MSETPNHELASKINTLQLLRLSVGVVEDVKTNPPSDEEKELIEKVFNLKNALMNTLDEDQPVMIVAMAAATQLLEDILCHYGEDMPDVLTAIISKLSTHGTLHMDLKDNPAKEVKFTGTIH